MLKICYRFQSFDSNFILTIKLMFWRYMADKKLIDVKPTRKEVLYGFCCTGISLVLLIIFGITIVIFANKYMQNMKGNQNYLENLPIIEAETSTITFVPEATIPVSATKSVTTSITNSDRSNSRSISIVHSFSNSNSNSDISHDAIDVEDDGNRKFIKKLMVMRTLRATTPLPAELGISKTTSVAASMPSSSVTQTADKESSSLTIEETTLLSSSSSSSENSISRSSASNVDYDHNYSSENSESSSSLSDISKTSSEMVAISAAAGYSEIKIEEITGMEATKLYHKIMNSNNNNNNNNGSVENDV